MRFYWSLMVLLLSLVSCSERDSVTNYNTSTDVYVGGQKDRHAAYWKNNQNIRLDDTGFSTSTVDTLVVKNQKVYALGTAWLEGETGSVQHRLLWINGVVSDLNATYATDTQEVVSIGALDVVGTDLYVSGIVHDLSVTPNVYRLVYWKNGQREAVAELADGNYQNTAMAWQDTNGYFSVVHPSLASGMFVNDVFHPTPDQIDYGYFHNADDLYVFGQKDQHPFYQKITADAVTNTELNGTFNQISAFGGAIFASNGHQIYRNATESYYSVSGGELVRFQWANNSLYTLEKKSAPEAVYEVKQNGVSIRQSTSGAVFTCLFVYIY